MYSVLIVDDEPWVLKGIRSTFKWDELGFQIIAETTDSLEAFDIIVKQKPDVIVTDIRMPELSGIDLMRRCRELGMKSEFIIISGASDFHYAQESIRMGCFDYLLKPIQFKEADAVLERLHRHLERLRQQKELDLLEALHHADEAQIKQLLAGKGIQSEALQAAYFSAASSEQLDQAASWIGEEGHVRLHADSTTMLLISGGRAPLYPLLSSKHEGSAASIKERLFVGVSASAAKPGHLPRLIEEAHLAMHASFIYSGGGVFVLSKEAHPTIRKAVQDVCAAILHSTADQVSALLSEIPQRLRAEGADMRDAVYMWNQCISALNHKYNNGEVPFHEELSFMDYGGLVNKFDHVDELCECLKRFIHSEPAPSLPESEQLVNENFKELLEYVNDHYEEELHLRELSNKFYINYTYCCDLFQKTAKVTFTDYVTRLRLKKAGQLLRESDLTISEICREAGYKDYHYFNKVFKKWYGITPSNYRKSQVSPNYGEGRG